MKNAKNLAVISFLPRMRLFREGTRKLLACHRKPGDIHFISELVLIIIIIIILINTTIFMMVIVIARQESPILKAPDPKI